MGLRMCRCDAEQGARSPEEIQRMEEEAHHRLMMRMAFESKEIRRAFIKRVYFILAIQLAVTFAIIMGVIYIEPIRYFVMTEMIFWWVCLGVSLMTLLLLICCASIRRKPMVALLLLFLFTICESFLMGGISCRYDTNSVLIAIGATTGVCLAVTLFAFQTKWDFTMCGGCLFVMSIALLILGICTIFFYDKILHLVYASVGTILFSLYLVYDTQMMLGGNHQFSIEPHEHVLAALHLYLDIILIFIYILQIIGLIDN